MSDLISRQAALDAVDQAYNIMDCEHGIKALPPAQQWIPVKYHVITEEERRKEGYPEEWVYYFDCQLPDSGQEILVTTKGGYVEKDVCCIDDGYYLDSGYDWIEDIAAWMALPEPYREVE